MKSNEVKVLNPEDAPRHAGPGVGRPQKYYHEFTQIAYRLTLLGLTDKEIAETLGVSKATLNKWKKQHPEFIDSVRRGKTLADGNVAMGLYQRATGYDYQSEKQFMTKDGEIVRVPITVHVPPDPGAAMNWLKNRQPDLWRDKQETALSGKIILTMNLSGDTEPNDKDEDYDKLETS